MRWTRPWPGHGFGAGRSRRSSATRSGRARRRTRRCRPPARAAGRELTMCGEIAGNPAYTELLLGLGLRRFSVAPGQMLEVKDAIRRIRLDEAERRSRQALELGTVAEIEALLRLRRFAQ